MSKYTEIFDSMTELIIAVTSFFGLVVGGIKLFKMRNATIKNAKIFKKIERKKEVDEAMDKLVKPICDNLKDKYSEKLFDVNIMEFELTNAESLVTGCINGRMVYSTIPTTLEQFGSEHASDDMFPQLLVEARDIGCARFFSNDLKNVEFSSYLDGNGIGEVVMFLAGVTENIITVMFLNFKKDAHPTLTDAMLSRCFRDIRKIGGIIKKNKLK